MPARLAPFFCKDKGHAQGLEDEALTHYRRVRDEIKAFV
jgi:hypothetical protein